MNDAWGWRALPKSAKSPRAPQGAGRSHPGLADDRRLDHPKARGDG